ncbi:MAG: 2-dehydropantoate 2-reductase [Thermoanaerobaculales bacterium]
MRVAVVGVGAVGGYFGGRLAHSGEDVCYIARGETLAALQHGGLRVDSIAGDFVIDPARAFADPAEVGAVDVVLVAVKAWQVDGLAPTLRSLLHPQTVVVPLQNGVEAADQLAATLGQEHVAPGVCHIVASVEAPGHVRHSGLEPRIAFGERDNRPSARLERLQRAFAQAKVKAQIPPDIGVALWEKFLFIASLSGMGAATRAPAGVVRRLPETRHLLVQAIGEVAAVARSRGVALPPDAEARTLAFIDALPEAATSSMQRDILAGRPSELEAQLGAVVRFGAQAGVPTPVAAFLYHVLLPQELQARGSHDRPL